MRHRAARRVGAFWIHCSFSLITQASPVTPWSATSSCRAASCLAVGLPLSRLFSTAQRRAADQPATPAATKLLPVFGSRCASQCSLPGAHCRFSKRSTTRMAANTVRRTCWPPWPRYSPTAPRRSWSLMQAFAIPGSRQSRRVVGTLSAGCVAGCVARFAASCLGASGSRWRICFRKRPQYRKRRAPSRSPRATRCQATRKTASQATRKTDPSVSSPGGSIHAAARI
ncbi:hypothetical protein DER72_13311 [Halomonas sp. A11-A]|nr:hypothetical protein DER72_13311 [Halomonas sp. A11-A]